MLSISPLLDYLLVESSQGFLKVNRFGKRVKRHRYFALHINFKPKKGGGIVLAVESMMILTVVFSGINSALLIVLLAIYGKIVFRTKAAHSIGLMLFATLLLAQNLLALYSYVDMSGYFASGVLPYLLGIAALELASLVTIVVVTL
jgi:hypothetical protein